MQASGSRRAFLRTALGVAVAAPYLLRFGRAGAGERSFDPSFGSAVEAARSIRAGVISSRELTEHVFARIRAHNPAINAFVAGSSRRRATRSRATAPRRKNCTGRHVRPRATRPRPQLVLTSAFTRSSASRSALRNSGLQGLALFSASG